MDNVQCTGSEDSLYDCLSTGKIEGKCEEHEGAGVRCSISGKHAMRLVGGTLTPGAASGNVYLGDNPVCGTGWDMNDGHHVCQMLG